LEKEEIKSYEAIYYVPNKLREKELNKSGNTLNLKNLETILSYDDSNGFYIMKRGDHISF
jgi:hypothetical protein